MKKVKIIPVKKNSELILNIDLAKKYIPDWYKNSPQKIEQFKNFSLSPMNPVSTTSTYKKCSPFLDALQNGYIFSLSQDVEVSIGLEELPKIMWRNQLMNPITDHVNQQWEGLEYPKDSYNYLFKWENYFIIKTPRGYSSLFTHPHNRFDLPFQTLSGIVETDKWNIPVHFPFFLKKDFSGIIEAGTPLAQVTFFKRDHWSRNISKYNEDFINNENNKFLSKIDRSYKNQFWEKKEYD